MICSQGWAEPHSSPNRPKGGAASAGHRGSSLARAGGGSAVARPRPSASGMHSETRRPFALPKAAGKCVESSRFGITRGAKEIEGFSEGDGIKSFDSASFCRCETGVPACSRNASSRKGTKEPDADRKRRAPFSFADQGDSRTSQHTLVNLRMMRSTHIRKRVSRWRMDGGGFTERGIDRDPGRPYSGTWREDTCRGVGPYFRFQRVSPFSRQGMSRQSPSRTQRRRLHRMDRGGRTSIPKNRPCRTWFGQGE
jgi:hypothetical protein